jgi:hypothetical protein
MNLSKQFINENYDTSYYRWCFDRAMQKEDKNASANAAGVASTEQGNASALGMNLTPFYRQEMNAQHLYSPMQNQAMLNAGAAPLASSLATAQGEARSQMARTRNTSGFSAALDQAARDRNSAMGQLSANIAAQDVQGAKALNQAGAQGMAGLYGIDTNAMLGAMGLRNQADQNAVEAGKSGWFQNLMGGIGTIAGALKPIK